jgi:hypothetical protein
MLASWVMTLMLVLQPQAPWSDSFAATASAIDQVVREERPLFGDDNEARAKTAALLVALAWAESRFKPNAIGRGGVRGLYQVGGHGDQSDPVRATRVALELIRESFRLCAARPVSERLAVYAGGGVSCNRASTDALSKSRWRVTKGLSLFMQHPPPRQEGEGVPSPG